MATLRLRKGNVPIRVAVIDKLAPTFGIPRIVYRTSPVEHNASNLHTSSIGGISQTSPPFDTKHILGMKQPLPVPTILTYWAQRSGQP